MSANDVVKWILNLFEIAAAATGFYYAAKWRRTHWRWFPWFLLFILVTELLAKYMYYQPVLRPHNYKIYRYANLPATVFFHLWLLAQAFAGKTMYRLAWLLAALYAVIWLVEEYWLPLASRKGISLSYIFGMLSILALIITWFYRLIRSPGVVFYKSNRQFWVNAGLLFYIVPLPFWAMYYALFKIYPDIFMVYWYISLAFTCIMYLFFILSFKWAKPKSSYSL